MIEIIQGLIKSQTSKTEGILEVSEMKMKIKMQRNGGRSGVITPIWGEIISLGGCVNFWE